MAILAVLVAALCFSTTGTALALAGVDAAPPSVGAARILLGGGILGLLALRTWRSHETRSSRRAWLIVGAGAGGVLAYQATFFLGTRVNGVAIGTVVALGSAPILAGLLESVVRHRVPSLRWAMATSVAIVGVVLVSGLVGPESATDPSASVRVSLPGLLASLGAGAAYAVYAVSAKLLLDRSWRPTQAMGSIFGVAAVFSLPVLLLTDTAWLATPSGLVLTLWLGIVTTTIAYLLFGWGLARIDATTAATLTLAEPLGATLLGLLLLNEQLTAGALVGLLIIGAGLALLSLPERRGARDVAAAT
jgi:DME family drug/metabolite transporter